jgi:hypothetical protein
MNFAVKAGAKVITLCSVPNVFLLVFRALLPAGFQLAEIQSISDIFYFLPMLTVYYPAFFFAGRDVELGVDLWEN